MPTSPGFVVVSRKSAPHDRPHILSGSYQFFGPGAFSVHVSASLKKHDTF
jgi:hypothetical protein